MDFNASRIGQTNGTGDERALFYKKFSGEVMTAFKEMNVMMPLHMVRTISSGKSAAFPAHGKATASYHQPGAEIDGQKILGAERVIHIDSLLVSPVFIPNIDEAMSEYSYRSIYSAECGAALANAADRNLLKVAVLAARENATVSGGFNGTVLNSGATVATNADVLVNAIYQAAKAMDEKDVPAMDRAVVLKPAQYYLAVQHDKLVNRDFTQGNGDFARGKVLRAADFAVVKSNHIPNTNTNAAASGEFNTYFGDFSATVAVVLQKRAIGTVKLLDLAIESEYSVRHQGTLIVAKYAMGHGILRPECAVEISAAA